MDSWEQKKQKTKLHLLRGEKLDSYLLHVQLNCMASLTLQQGAAEGEYLVKIKEMDYKQQEECDFFKKIIVNWLPTMNKDM